MGRAIILCAIALGWSACGVCQLPPAQVYAGSLPARSAQYWAGVESVDITPPIGLGMFGHGPESRVSTGIALRLRCQVFVISAPRVRDERFDVVALVPCELPAPSLYLQRAIASYVARQHVPLPASRIALMATHTHFGPGHFFASDGYTGPFSARRSGLDDGFVGWLAQRIGSAIRDAYWHARPARLGWAYKDLHGIARNRSVVPFLANATLPPALAAAVSGADQPELAAIDPKLSLLRIDQWEPSTHQYVAKGALAVYGVHPSVVNNRNSLYSGDLFGYATRHASTLIEAKCTKTPCAGLVVGLANGIEGDVTSQRASDTHLEARRLGERLGAEIAELWSHFETDAAATLQTKGQFAIAYRELEWSQARLADGRRLCEQPRQGTPAAGGASDHPTSMRIFSVANPGVRARASGDPKPCDWPRFPLIGLDPTAKPGANYPDVAPIMLLQIGSGLIATAPAELTTTVGLRIRDELRSTLAPAIAEVTVVGLTNEYLSYIATAEEYALQHYEGASTLYGPDSAQFLAEQLRCLAAELKDPAAHCSPQPQHPTDVPLTASYSATRTKLVPDGPPPASSERPHDMSEVRTAIANDGERYYRVRFAGPEPYELWAWDDLEIAVERDRVPITNGRGADIRIEYDANASLPWAVDWIVPHQPAAQPCGATLRFAITTRQQTLRSNPFKLVCDLPQAASTWP